MMNGKAKLNYEKSGLKIYHAIEESGLTYEIIAKEVGLGSPRIIYEWVRGTKLPTLPRLVLLASALSVQITDLLVIE